MASPVAPFADLLATAKADMDVFDDAEIETICYGDRDAATRVVFDTLARRAFDRVSFASEAIILDLGALACLWATRAEGLPLLEWLLTLPKPVQPLFEAQKTRKLRLMSRPERKQRHKELVAAACKGGVEAIIRWVFALPATRALAEKSEHGKLKQAYAVLVHNAPLALIQDVKALLPARTTRLTTALFTQLFQRDDDTASMAILHWLLATRTEADVAFLESEDGIDAICTTFIAPQDQLLNEASALARLQCLVDAVKVNNDMNEGIARKVIESGNKALVTYWLGRVPRPSETPLSQEFIVSGLFAAAFSGDGDLDFVQWLHATHCSGLVPGKQHPVNTVLRCFAHKADCVEWFLGLPGVMDSITLPTLNDVSVFAGPALLERIVDGIGQRLPLCDYADKILDVLVCAATTDRPLVHCNPAFLQRLADAAQWGDTRTPKTVYSKARANGLAGALEEVSAKGQRHPQLIEFFARQLAAEVSLFGDADHASAGESDEEEDCAASVDDGSGSDAVEDLGNIDTDADADTPQRKRRRANDKGDDDDDESA